MSKSTSIHPVWLAIRSLFNKLRQNPDVYPIDYYKKARFNRKRRAYNYK